MTGPELSSFVESLVPRSSGVMDGLDIEGNDVIIGVDGPSPYDSFSEATGSWSAVWSTDEDSDVLVALQKAPAEIVELQVGFAASYLGSVSEPRPGEPFILIEDDGFRQVIWARPDLGVYLTIMGETENALDAALALIQIPENEWVTTVTPFVRPPPTGEGN